MIFVNEEFEAEEDIVICGYYMPYSRWKNDPEMAGVPYDLYSRKILDLKDGKRSAINYFYTLLDEEICSGVAICVVPSHSPQSVESGVIQLARKLAAHDRIDMTDYLIRTKEIEKLATGGNRNIDVHLNSIEVDPRISITGEVILVVDDVTTSGNSLYACRDILLRNGASRVALLALGQTVR